MEIGGLDDSAIILWVFRHGRRLARIAGVITSLFLCPNASPLQVHSWIGCTLSCNIRNKTSNISIDKSSRSWFLFGIKKPGDHRYLPRSCPIATVDSRKHIQAPSLRIETAKHSYDKYLVVVSQYPQCKSSRSERM